MKMQSRHAAPGAEGTTCDCQIGGVRSADSPRRRIQLRAAMEAALSVYPWLVLTTDLPANRHPPESRSQPRSPAIRVEPASTRWRSPFDLSRSASHKRREPSVLGWAIDTQEETPASNS